MSQLLSVVRTLTLTQPGVLLTLVVAVPLVLLAAHSRLRLTPAPLRAGILFTRLSVATLVILALAMPTLRPTGQGRAIVFAIDASDSVSADQLAWARGWAESAAAALPAGSHSTVIEFGTLAQLGGSSQPPPGGSTDLSAALELAGSIIQRESTLNPEIVLLTDGWHTASSAPPVDALPSGVAVSYVPLPASVSAQQPVAVIHALNAPTVARAGDHIEVQLDLQAAQAVDAQLLLRVDQRVVASGPVHLEPGEMQLSLPATIAAPGFVPVRADLRVGSVTSTLTAVVVAKPAGKVLVLEDDAGSADSLVSLLTNQGLQVVRRPSNSVPPRAQDLDEFDGVLLVNTPATSLALDQQRTLQSYVQDLGRGLVVTGGARTFSPGGYEGSVLDDLLPVSATPPIEPKQGSLALFLVIDRSGSMDIVSGGGSGTPGATKMAMAREAAIEAAGLLQPEDTLGVIAFDSSYQWVVQPTKLHTPEDIKQVQARIATIKAGGGTSILQPLQAAFEAAAAADAPLKHIVLMTDGESNDRGFEDLIARMSASQITLSALAIGSDADTRLLTSLAHLGGGRYYFTERSTQIPRIASKETSILTRNAVIEGQVAAVVGDPSPVLRSISGDLPKLSGYVATTRKDRAVTALETERGHPLLAHWQYGLGRVVAWTSEAQQGWASDWSNWPDAAQFWSQAVRWTLPAPVQANFQPVVQVQPDGRQVTLSVQALGDDGRFADQQATRATVMSPDGSARELALTQRGPGAYAEDTRVSAPGEYRVLFQQGQREEVAAFTAPDSVERHSVGLNAALLNQLATSSGGHSLRSPTDLTAGNGPGPSIELWPWLLLAALLLLPLDVYLRRRT
jgi:Ca-activated chloride channel homolog